MHKQTHFDHVTATVAANQAPGVDSHNNVGLFLTNSMTNVNAATFANLAGTSGANNGRKRLRR